MDRRNGLSGCQIAGIILAVLVIAPGCLGAGFVLGGGVGLVTGGAAGYAIGRMQSYGRPFDEDWMPPDLPLPVRPVPEDDEWDQTTPEGRPGMELRPYLGVRYRTVREGAQIVVVEPDTPAADAGLHEGDVILAVDGKPVGEGGPDLTARILEYKPGDEVELLVERDNEELDLEVTLGSRIVIERSG
jgi:membrane-associated protease RseP (regulator of RpoE activity)